MRVARSQHARGNGCYNKEPCPAWLYTLVSVFAHTQSQHPAPAMVKVTTAQKRRADLFVLLLQGHSLLAAKKQLKIKNTSYVRSLISHLKDTADLADAPRSGRPEKYGEDLMWQAKEFLLGLEDAAFCCKDVVAAMVDYGVLPEDTSWASFWPKFVMYLGSHGLSLVWGIQRLTFAMTKKHATARLRWCQQYQHVFTDRTMRHYVFVDEISLEYGGHPKGGWGRGAGWCAGASMLDWLTCISPGNGDMEQHCCCSETVDLPVRASTTSKAGLAVMQVCRTAPRGSPPGREGQLWVDSLKPAQILIAFLSNPLLFNCCLLCRNKVCTCSLVHQGTYKAAAATLCAHGPAAQCQAGSFHTDWS